MAAVQKNLNTGLYMALFTHAQQFLTDYDGTYRVDVEELQQNQHRATYLIDRYFSASNNRINLANTAVVVEEGGDDDQVAAYDRIEEAHEAVSEESASEGDVSDENE